MLTVFGEGIRVPARIHLACSSPTSSLDALLVAIYTQDQKLVEKWSAGGAMEARSSPKRKVVGSKPIQHVSLFRGWGTSLPWSIC